MLERESRPTTLEKEIQSFRMKRKISLSHQLIASLPLLFHPSQRKLIRPSTQKAFHHFEKRAREGKCIREIGRDYVALENRRREGAKPGKLIFMVLAGFYFRSQTISALATIINN